MSWNDLLPPTAFRCLLPELSRLTGCWSQPHLKCPWYYMNLVIYIILYSVVWSNSVIWIGSGHVCCLFFLWPFGSFDVLADRSQYFDEHFDRRPLNPSHLDDGDEAKVEVASRALSILWHLGWSKVPLVKCLHVYSMELPASPCLYSLFFRKIMSLSWGRVGAPQLYTVMGKPTYIANHFENSWKLVVASWRLLLAWEGWASQT